MLVLLFDVTPFRLLRATTDSLLLIPLSSLQRILPGLALLFDVTSFRLFRAPTDALKPIPEQGGPQERQLEQGGPQERQLEVERGGSGGGGVCGVSAAGAAAMLRLHFVLRDAPLLGMHTSVVSRLKDRVGSSRVFAQVRLQMGGGSRTPSNPPQSGGGGCEGCVGLPAACLGHLPDEPQVVAFLLYYSDEPQVVRVVKTDV
jgi:hypothetical protein